jgi:hypothetical protein
MSQLSMYGNDYDDYGRRNGSYSVYSSDYAYEILGKQKHTSADIAMWTIGGDSWSGGTPESNVKEVLDYLRSQGITTIHGRPIEEVIVAEGSDAALAISQQMVSGDDDYFGLSDQHFPETPIPKVA